LGVLLTKNVPIYQHKIGGYLAKELNEIAGKISKIGSFPQRFSTIEQGEFALGYYFQRTNKKESTENINS
jgi:CRISPR-associated protein Csd1